MRAIAHHFVTIETGDGTIHTIELTDDEKEAHREGYRSGTLQQWAADILNKRGLVPLDNSA